MFRFIATVLFAVALLATQAAAQCVNMPSAFRYSVLAATTVTNSGASRFTGYFGVTSGSNNGLTNDNVLYPTGGLQLGTTESQTALAEVQTAYSSIAALSFTDLTSGSSGTTELGGRLLAAGNYRVTGNAQLNGQLRLTTSGTYNFYITGSLVVGQSATVTQDVTNSNACVTWAIQTTYTLGTSAQFYGFVIARQTLSLGQSSTVVGGVASFADVTSTAATVTNSGVNCCGGGGSTPVTTVYAWVITSFGTCSTFGNTALCNTAGTSSASYSCASASSTTGFYSVLGQNTNCAGVSTQVVCLSQGTSGSIVTCNVPATLSGASNFVSSPITQNFPSQTFGCYTACNAATVTYVWVFQGFASCSQPCGQSSNLAGSFSCYSTTSTSGGFYTATGNQNTCTSAGNSLSVICISGNTQTACSNVFTASDLQNLPSFSNNGQVPSITKTCPAINCPTETNNNPGSWCIGEFGACSATCGANGVQTRQVTCVSATDGSPLADSSCMVDGTQPKPTSTQSCNTAVVCPCHSWVVSAWGACGGCRSLQTRTAKCVLIENPSVEIPEQDCKAAMSKPSLTQLCNTEDATCIKYQWVYGNYGTCFPSCGTSRTATRSRTCYGSVNPNAPVIVIGSNGLPANDVNAFVALDSACTGAGIGDAGTTTTCPVVNCNVPTYQWAQDAQFTGCSINNCGGGIATKRVWCVSSQTSSIVTDALCLASLGQNSKPATSQLCNTQACPSYHYVPGAWTACSSTCGTGYRQRSVACYAGAYTTNGQLNNNIDMSQPVSMSLCQSQPVPVPVTFEECSAAQACTILYSWYAAQWSGCSASCGGGTQTRVVSCWSSEFDQRDPVNDALCPQLSKPVAQQSCNVQACTQYIWTNPGFGACSCETRQQTRTPMCYPRLANGQPDTSRPSVSDSFCAGQTDPNNSALPCPWALAKPVSTQNCVPSGCTEYYWWAGTWSTCNNAQGVEIYCAGGTRTRSVLCYSYADDTVVPSSFCQGATPTYTSSEACNTQACTFFQWRDSVFCACTKQCGGGVQTKSLQCYAMPENVAVPDSYCANANPAQSSFVLSQTCNTQPCTSYTWLTLSWSGCNKNCGCGRETRTVVCVPTNNQQLSAAVSDDKCQFNVGGKDITYRACNTNPCPPVYFWAVTAWQGCTAECGTTGTQQRAVNCYYSDLPDTTCQTNRWLVAPTSPLFANCPTPAPRSVRPCNRQVCVSYAWYWSEWSQCSVTCGGGTRTRNVACYASNNSNNYVSDSFCPNGLGSGKPQNTESCNPQPCDNYIWIADNWSTCSLTCGGGVSTRTVSCYAASDKTIAVNDALCTPVAAGSNALTGARTPKPSTTQVCNSCACAPSYQYYYDQWSQCTKTCGGGVQTRFGGCFASDNPNVILADTACVGLTKQITTQACNVQACDTYYWAVGAWSTCPAVCPTSQGTQTRTVQCFATSNNVNALTDEQPCLSLSGGKPATSQACTSECRSCSWSYFTNSQCSKSCNGVSYRTATCTCSDSTGAQSPTLCSSQPQDTTQLQPIPCNVNSGSADCVATSYAWFTGVLGTCSATCGTGSACRVVYCYNQLDANRSPVADSFCAGLGTKPAATQDCNMGACTQYAWFSVIGACPVTCGTGYTINDVTCRVQGLNGVSGNVVSDALCNAALKPVTSNTCGSGVACVPVNNFQWIYGNQGTCSTSCGNGRAYRSVICQNMLTGLQALDSACDINLKGDNYVVCNIGLSTAICPTNYCLSTRNDIWSCWATDRSLGVEPSFCQWSTGFSVSASGTNNWIVGPYSSCNGGQKSRSVTCWSSTTITNNGSGQSFASSGCNTNSMPSQTATC